MSNVKKELNEFTKEELIKLCEKQENEIKQRADTVLYWVDKCSKLEKKLETLKNIIEL